jgi:hypothetical protein
LIGIELAEMLRLAIFKLLSVKTFWVEFCLCESQINRHIVEHHIDLKLETNLVEIISDENGHVKAVITDKGETMNW